MQRQATRCIRTKTVMITSRLEQTCFQGQMMGFYQMEYLALIGKYAQSMPFDIQIGRHVISKLTSCHGHVVSKFISCQCTVNQNVPTHTRTKRYISRPMPYMNMGSNETTDAGGNFFQESQTATFEGPYVMITDNCGTASLNSSPEAPDVDWGGISVNTDCKSCSFFS